MTLSPLSKRHVRHVFGADILGARANQAVIGVLFQRILRQGGFKMLVGHHAFKAKFRSGTLKFSNRKGIGEYIIEPAKMSGTGTLLKRVFRSLTS